MQRWWAFFRRLPVLLICPGLAVTVGLLIPSAYEFTQRPAARHQHDGLEMAAAGAAMLTLIACWIAGRRDHLAEERIATARDRKLQFGLRGAFIGMTLAAVGLAAIPRLFDSYLAGLNVVLIVAIVMWSLRSGRPSATRTVAMLATMFLPFAWLVSYTRPWGRANGLFSALPFAPGLLSAALTSMVIRQPTMDDLAQVAAAFVMLQLLLAGWLAHRGGKLSVAYMFLLFVSSALSSFAFHALYRA